MTDINGIEIKAGMTVKTKFLGKDIPRPGGPGMGINVNDYDTFTVKQKSSGGCPYVEKAGYKIPLRENDRTLEVISVGD